MKNGDRSCELGEENIGPLMYALVKFHQVFDVAYLDLNEYIDEGQTNFIKERLDDELCINGDWSGGEGLTNFRNWMGCTEPYTGEWKGVIHMHSVIEGLRHLRVAWVIIFHQLMT